MIIRHQPLLLVMQFLILPWMLIAVMVLPALARDCIAPPRYIQISYDFEWSGSAQSSLAQRLALQCGEVENLFLVERALSKSLMAIGVHSDIVVTERISDAQIATIFLKSKNQSGSVRSVMMPVREISFDATLIPVFKVQGEPIEGNELIVSYSLDKSFVNKVGADVSLHWLVDGVPVEQARESKYQIKFKDVGKHIGAVLKLLIDGRVVATRKAELTTQVIMAEKPPVVKDLQITGNPSVGHKLLATYQFQDLNKEDSEENSEVSWLRSNSVIPGVKGIEYTLVPNDIGHHISVQVVPRSADGLYGKPALFSMSKKVDDGLVKLSPQLIDSLITAPTENTEAFKSIKDLMDEVKAAANRPILESQSDQPSLLLNSVFITKGFTLAPGSPRQFTGFIFDSNTMFSATGFAQIEAELVGKNITMKFLKRAVAQINQAYKDAGFEFSRALLPNQTVKDGRVKLKLVELKIGDIQIEGPKRFSRSLLLEQLGSEVGSFVALEDDVLQVSIKERVD